MNPRGRRPNLTLKKDEWGRVEGWHWTTCDRGISATAADACKFIFESISRRYQNIQLHTHSTGPSLRCFDTRFILSRCMCSGGWVSLLAICMWLWRTSGGRLGLQIGEKSVGCSAGGLVWEGANIRPFSISDRFRPVPGILRSG